VTSGENQQQIFVGYSFEGIHSMDITKAALLALLKDDQDVRDHIILILAEHRARRGESWYLMPALRPLEQQHATSGDRSPLCTAPEAQT